LDNEEPLARAVAAGLDRVSISIAGTLAGEAAVSRCAYGEAAFVDQFSRVLRASMGTLLYRL
jgi:hypothetical protein